MVGKPNLQARTHVAQEWVAHHEAAVIVGCGLQTINRRKLAGDITCRRERDRKLPSLNTASVEAFAQRWRSEQIERQQHVPKNIREYGPPNDGDVWFDTRIAALVIGITHNACAQEPAGRAPRVAGVGRRWPLGDLVHRGDRRRFTNLQTRDAQSGREPASTLIAAASGPEEGRLCHHHALSPSIRK